MAVGQNLELQGSPGRLKTGPPVLTHCHVVQVLSLSTTGCTIGEPMTMLTPRTDPGCHPMTCRCRPATYVTIISPTGPREMGFS